MTEADGILRLLERFHIGARVVPGGDEDETWYEPNPGDVEICEAVLGCKLWESDLLFQVGTSRTDSWYFLGSKAIMRAQRRF